MTDEIHIAFTVDCGYLNQAAVTIASIVANTSTPEALRFYIVHSDDDAWIAGQVALWGRPHVQTVKVENPFAQADMKGSRLTSATWLRMTLPDVFSQLNRVIYLDADLVVLADIRDLWRTDLGEAAIGGVVDIGIYRYARRGEARGDYFYRNYLISLGLDPARPNYINTGVILMDLGKLREMGFSRLCREAFLSRRDRLVLADQDIVNAAMRGQVTLLDPRWNALARGLSKAGKRHDHYVPDALRSDLTLQQSEQWVIHYIGRHKPWSSAGVWGEDAWWRYAPQSGVEWRRPVPERSLAKSLKEAWLDVRSVLSRYHFELRKKQGR